MTKCIDNVDAYRDFQFNLAKAVGQHSFFQNSSLNKKMEMRVISPFSEGSMQRLLNLPGGENSTLSGQKSPEIVICKELNV
jgi:hypothetical protein